jgi:prepilin-type N-terminal cleavage/methylation domain-containing protein/prepilin-type processing-associated H-X9-DG protein
MIPLNHPQSQQLQSSSNVSTVKNDAFTLIELLTVIAIIGILAAILIPAIGKVRERAASAKSVSNLRQFGVAIQAYTSDNKGRYPVTWGKQSDNGPQELWHHEIAPFMGMDKKPSSKEANGLIGSFWPVYVSPTTIAPKEFDSTVTHLMSTYSMNGNLNKIEPGPNGNSLQRGFPTVQVVNPASTVLVLDGGQWAIGSQADANIGRVRTETRNSTTPDSLIQTTEPNEDGLTGWGTVSYRDNGRAATLWCDGHVSHVEKGDFKHKHFNINF